MACVAFDGDQRSRRCEDAIEGGDFGSVVEDRSRTMADDATDIVRRDMRVVECAIDERRKRLS